MTDAAAIVADLRRVADRLTEEAPGPAPDPIAAAIGMWLTHPVTFDQALGLPARWREDLRRDERDALIREARVHSSASSDTADAKRLAQALRAYVGTLWPADRRGLPPNARELRRALYRIVTLNDGKALSWRQVLNVLSGNRGGVCKSGASDLHGQNETTDPARYIPAVTE